MEHRYARNIPAISREEQALLRRKKVLVLGCGGLGGCLVESLTRMGVGSITAVDGDVFEESNLNRQLLATSYTLGKNKAEAAAERAALIDPNIEFRAVVEFFDERNAKALLAGQDLVLDALDSIPARLLLEDTCEAFGIPLAHGAVNGWQLQASLIMPGSRLLHRLYASAQEADDKSTLPMTVQACAAITCAEAVKLLTGAAPSLKNKLLIGDLLHQEWEVLEF